MSAEGPSTSAEAATRVDTDAGASTTTAPSEPIDVAKTNGAEAEESKETAPTNAQPEVAPSEPLKQDESTDQDASNSYATTSANPKPDGESNGNNSVTATKEEVTPDNENSNSKLKGNARRKSGGVPEHKKKLNKKASKANLTHTDAKPGDHFFARLKGFPPWPVVICDEVMLPNELIKSRPASAAREDGDFQGEYQDGGSKVKDRQFAIMYLYTNEFGWIRNTDLQELDFETVGNVPGKMRKDLQEAHKLASEQHDLDYYKLLLSNFMEQKEADLKAQQAAAEAKAAKQAAKVKKDKTKSQKVVRDDDDDVEMADGDSDEVNSAQRKRKAEDEAIPGDPSKKPKIAIKFTAPQTPNGNQTAKTAKESSTKSAKSKPKKSTPKASATESSAPKEPELTTEEKRAKKEKEILFLRHKLQKGLLTRDQPPKEDEMKQMSEFISKLEGYSELEVSIIRATKINKVLKAIIKLSAIPKEEEFNFKSRSQTLLDKWNKLLAGEQSNPAASATTNGTSENKIEGQGQASSAEPVNEAQEVPQKEDDQKEPSGDATETKESEGAGGKDDKPSPEATPAVVPETTLDAAGVEKATSEDNE